MNAEWIELTDWETLAGTYAVYRHCMHAPTPERFRQKAEGYLCDEAVRLYACRESGEIRGVIVAACTAPGVVEILGIAVGEAQRRRGIGAWMIRRLAERHDCAAITAETDGDAVGFYQRCGFAVTPFTRVYDGQPVKRYRCVLRGDCRNH